MGRRRLRRARGRRRGRRVRARAAGGDGSSRPRALRAAFRSRATAGRARRTGLRPAGSGTRRRLVHGLARQPDGEDRAGDAAGCGLRDGTVRRRARARRRRVRVRLRRTHARSEGLRPVADVPSADVRLAHGTPRWLGFLWGVPLLALVRGGTRQRMFGLAAIPALVTWFFRDPKREVAPAPFVAAADGV